MASQPNSRRAPPAVQESRWGPGRLLQRKPAPLTASRTVALLMTAPMISASGANTNSICINMPVVCTDSTATLTGTLAQWGNQNAYGGDGYGLVPATNSSGKRTISGYDTSTVSFPATCNPSTMPSGHVPGSASEYIRQFIAYIPNTDIYGNNLLHGVVASGTSPYGTISNGYDTRENWIFQVNQECSPDPTVLPNCKNVGGLWSSFSTIGTGSNFFPSTNPYANANVTHSAHLRPDQSNTIVAASMNGTMSEAYTIRSDTTYHPVIHTIYLTGNGSDSVDHEFLAIVANCPKHYLLTLRFHLQFRERPCTLCQPGLSDHPGNRQISGHFGQECTLRTLCAARERSFAPESLTLMRTLLVLAFLQTAWAAEPLRSGCSPDNEQIAAVGPSDQVKVLLAEAGWDSPCYKVIVTRPGQSLSGYVLGNALPAIREFQSEREKASAAASEAAARLALAQAATTNSAGPEPEKPKDPLISTKFEDFSGRDSKGKAVSLSGLNGRVTVVTFWSPKSASSQNELMRVMPLYSQLHKAVWRRSVSAWIPTVIKFPPHSTTVAPLGPRCRTRVA